MRQCHNTRRFSYSRHSLNKIDVPRDIRIWWYEAYFHLVQWLWGVLSSRHFQRYRLNPSVCISPPYNQYNISWKYHGNSYPALVAESWAAFALPAAAVDDSARAAIIGGRTELNKGWSRHAPVIKVQLMWYTRSLFGRNWDADKKLSRFSLQRDIHVQRHFHQNGRFYKWFYHCWPTSGHYKIIRYGFLWVGSI